MRVADSVWSEPAALAVQDRMVRALHVLRVVVLANALAVNLYRFGNFRTPTLGVLAIAVLIGWTAFAIWAYDDRRRRTPWLIAADLAVAVGMILASPLVKVEHMRATVPGFWVMGALMAWAVCWRVWGGFAAAVAIAVADFAVREVYTQANYGNTFLLLVGGPIVGYLCAQLYRFAVERDRAERAAAAAAERTRLARAVHDGVLQVLALMQRRGAESARDPELADIAELGRLAGEQEVALRALIRQQDAVPETSTDTEADLMGTLQAHESLPAPHTVVSGPSGAVAMPAAVVEELDAVVGQCLSNVRHHVGPEARAWVLVEEMGSAVVVTVRDEGPGIPEGRVDEARDQGRLGIAESICGRMRDLGGSATLSTGSWGTEWELEVPRA